MTTVVTKQGLHLCEHPKREARGPPGVLPTVRAVTTLGGSATAREITSQVVTDLAPTDEMLAVAHPHRPDDSVFMERVQWARSYANAACSS